MCRDMGASFIQFSSANSLLSDRNSDNMCICKLLLVDNQEECVMCVCVCVWGSSIDLQRANFNQHQMPA